MGFVLGLLEVLVIRYKLVLVMMLVKELNYKLGVNLYL